VFRRQSVLAISIAVLLAFVAVFLLNSYLAGVDQQAESSGGGQTTRVAVARVPLEFGTQLVGDQVAFVEWPVDSVAQGSFTSAAELFPGGRSRFVMRAISPGEPILASRLSGEGSPSIAAALGPDMRAASIRISDVAGVAGFILPGDRVDVLMTREVDGEQFSDLLLQNVRVIAVDQVADEARTQVTSGEASALKTATLEVSPDGAQRLALGSAVGTLSLTLRSPRSRQPGLVAEAVPLRSGQLVGGAPRRGATAPAPAPAAAVPQGYARIEVTRSANPPRSPDRTTPPVRPRSDRPNVEVFRGVASQQYEVPSAHF
jgi:pilus assembly protein CpaB